MALSPIGGTDLLSSGLVLRSPAIAIVAANGKSCDQRLTGTGKTAT